MAKATRPVLLRFVRLSSTSIRIEFADADGCYDAAEYEALEDDGHACFGECAGDYHFSTLRGVATYLRCTDGLDAPREMLEVIGELLCMPRSAWSAEALAVQEVMTPLVDGLFASLGGPVGEPDAESVGWITRQAEALRKRIEAGIEAGITGEAVSL